MQDACVDEKRGTGMIEGMKRNSDGTITRWCCRPPSGFPASRRDERRDSGNPMWSRNRTAEEDLCQVLRSAHI